MHFLLHLETTLLVQGTSPGRMGAEPELEQSSEVGLPLLSTGLSVGEAAPPDDKQNQLTLSQLPPAALMDWEDEGHAGMPRGAHELFKM